MLKCIKSQHKMNLNLQKDRVQLLIYALPVFVILTSIFLALSPLLSKNPDLAMGITYDLTLTAPLIYFFLIRKKSIPNISIVPLFVVGVILASFILPEHQKFHLDLVKTYLLPLVELIFISIISYKVYHTVKAFKDSPNRNRDFYLILKQSAIKVVGYPTIAKVFASEIAMVYYALFTWEKVKVPANGFTNFKENGITALLAVIVFIIVIEAFVFHILLMSWSASVAWVLTAGSGYAAFQIFGHIKAIKRRHSMIQGNKLYLKYGLFGDVEVSLEDIQEIKLISNNITDEDRIVEKLALLKDIENHNVAIFLTKKLRVEKAYGISKECDTILLHIDNKDEFVQKVGIALQQCI